VNGFKRGGTTVEWHIKKNGQSKDKRMEIKKEVYFGGEAERYVSV
jgi:hypothetical protein